ncbi:MAG: hypothetical protein ACO1SV_17440 [Fimbriimonas sp.]
MVAFTTVVALLIAPQSSRMGPDPTRDVLLTEKDAVFLLDPEAVAGSGATRLIWSPDGTYLLILRQQFAGPHPFALMAQGKPMPQAPMGEQQFLIHAAKSKRTVPALRLPLNAHIRDVEWLPGSSKALVLGDVRTPAQPGGEATDPVQTLFWMSSSGETRKLAEAADGEYLEIFVAPNRPNAVLSRMQIKTRPNGPTERLQTLQFLDSEGKPQGKIEMSDPTNTVVWAPDGRIYASVGKVVDRRVTWNWFRLNPAQGTREKVDNFTPPATSKADAGEFEVHSGPMPMAGPVKDMAPMQGVLMSVRSMPKSFVFVSTDAEAGTLAPDEKSVAYIHRGVPMVRPFARLPKQMYLDMKAAADRAVVMSNAKQAALALIMYAADNDDNLLATSANWQDTIMPYIKNREILNGFVYTFAGGPATGIEAPAETPIGYMPGPGGYAVAYADGHVKWRTDKP